MGYDGKLPGKNEVANLIIGALRQDKKDVVINAEVQAELDQSSFKAAEAQIEKLTKPKEVDVNTSKAEQKIKKLMEPLKAVQKTIKEIGGSGADFNIAHNTISQYEKLKVAVSDVAKSIGSTSQELKDAQRIIKDIDDTIKGLNITVEKAPKKPRAKKTNDKKEAEQAATAIQADPVPEVKKEVKSIEELEQRYRSLIQAVQEWKKLSEDVKSIKQVKNAADLRKQVIDLVSQISSDAAHMIGPIFEAELVNGFKGIKTKDILAQIAQLENADLLGHITEQLNVLNNIDLKNFNLSEVLSLESSSSGHFIELYDVLKKIVQIQGQMDSPVKKATDAIEAQGDVAEKAAQSQEKLNNARQKASKIKVREFTKEEYEAHQEQYQADNDGGVESLEETVDIIRQASQFGTQFETDMITACKRSTTAVKRFFEAIDPDKYPGLAGWRDGILESVQNGYFSERSMLNNGLFTGEYSWGVEALDDDRFYVYLNLLDVAKDKESEFSAHIEAESKKRDEGVAKEIGLYAALREAYEKLSDLRKNEPEWDNTDQVKSHEQRIEYYEKERALMQEILGLKEEFQSIPGKYRDRKASEVDTMPSLYDTEKVTSASLEETDRSIKIYRAGLIKATERQTAALHEQASAAESAAQAQEKLNDATKKTPKVDIDRVYSAVKFKVAYEDEYKAVIEDRENIAGVLKEQKEHLTGRLSPVKEAASRISKAASIKDIPYDSLRQEAASAGQRLSTMYDEGITDTEEYIALQYKLINILDKLANSYGGVKGSGAKSLAQLRSWIFNSIAQETGFNIGQSYAVDAIFGQDQYSIYNHEGKKRNVREIAGELVGYKGTLFTGGFGAEEDYRQLSQINTILEAINDNAQSTGQKVSGITEAQTQALREQEDIKKAIAKLNELSNDPYDIKNEDEVNRIYQERLAIIKQIGAEKLKAYSEDEYEGAQNVNQEYQSRLTSFAEARDNDVYDEIWNRAFYDNEQIQSAQELEELLEKRLGLLQKISLTDTDLYRDELEENKLIEDRIALMKRLEPLVESGAISKNDLEDIVFENGTLGERIDTLNAIQMNAGKAFDETWDDALQDAQMFLDTYEKILVTTASGKKLELGPDMSMEDYRAFLRMDTESTKSVEFVRKQTQALREQEQATDAVTKSQEKLNDKIKESNILYHAGDLSNPSKTMKSLPLGHVAPRRGKDSVFNGFTGLYTTEDVDGFWGNEWDGAPISSIDISHYKMFDARDNDLATKAQEFFGDLNSTIYGYYRFFDFESGEMKTSTDVKTVEALYDDFKEVFKGIDLDFESFKNFVIKSKAIVEGHQFEEIEVPDIDMGIAKSNAGTVLQGVSQDVFNSDSFQTQLLKMLGFEGIDLRGSKYNGTYTGGTVLFDVKPESIKAVNEKWSDVMARNGYEIDEVNLQHEEKRRQLAFDTAKAYSQQAEVASAAAQAQDKLNQAQKDATEIKLYDGPEGQFGLFENMSTDAQEVASDVADVKSEIKQIEQLDGQLSLFDNVSSEAKELSAETKALADSFVNFIGTLQKSDNVEWGGDMDVAYTKVLDGIKDGTFKTVDECKAKFEELTSASKDDVFNKALEAANRRDAKNKIAESEYDNKKNQILSRSDEYQTELEAFDKKWTPVLSSAKKKYRAATTDIEKQLAFEEIQAAVEASREDADALAKKGFEIVGSDVWREFYNKQLENQKEFELELSKLGITPEQFEVTRKQIEERAKFVSGEIKTPAKKTTGTNASQSQKIEAEIMGMVSSFSDWIDNLFSQSTAPNPVAEITEVSSEVATALNKIPPAATDAADAIDQSVKDESKKKDQEPSVPDDIRMQSVSPVAAKPMIQMDESEIAAVMNPPVVKQAEVVVDDEDDGQLTLLDKIDKDASKAEESVSELNDELQLTEEANRINKEREGQFEAYTFAANSLLGHNSYDSVSFDDKNKLFEDFTNKIMQDGMSASDAMDQLYLAMEALRKQSEAMPDNVTNGWEAEVQKLETHINSLGEEFKSSEQYRDNFNVLVQGIKSGSISAEQAIKSIDDAFESFTNDAMGDADKALDEVVAGLEKLSVSEISRVFNNISLSDFLKSFNIDKDNFAQFRKLFEELLQIDKAMQDGTVNASAFTEQVERITDAIIHDGGHMVDLEGFGTAEEMQRFQKYMSNKVVRYTDSTRKEYTKEDWASLRKRFGSRITTDETKGMTANELWDELVSEFPSLFSPRQDNDKDQFRALFDTLASVIDASKTGYKTKKGFEQSDRSRIQKDMVDIYTKMQAILYADDVHVASPGNVDSIIKDVMSGGPGGGSDDGMDKQDFGEVLDAYKEYLKLLKEIQIMDLDTSRKDHADQIANKQDQLVQAKEKLLRLGVDIEHINENELLDLEQKQRLLKEEEKARKAMYDVAANKTDRTSDLHAKGYDKLYSNELTKSRGLDTQIRAIGDDGVGDTLKGKIDAYKVLLNELETLDRQLANNKALATDSTFTQNFEDTARKAKDARVEIEGIVEQSQKLEKVSDGSLIDTKELNTSELKNLRASMISFGASLEDGEFKLKGFNKAGTEMYGVLDDGSGALRNITVALNGANDKLYAYGTTTERVSNQWEDFKSEIADGAKNIVGMYVGFQEAMQAVSQGVEYVKEIDLAMTELKKVTDETDLSYKQFLEDASGTSAAIGSTISDFTEATATFARLGYSLEEASSMAETAVVYRNVADGLDTIEESSDSIISTMMAFGIEASDTMSIIDRFNAVGNNFAITSAGIGEALQRSASALYEGGNTIDESIALITAANQVVQNPETVGTAFKTLTLRLRGAKTELEEAGLETEAMAESTSQLQEKLKALTGGKVDIMQDADTFKSTTQILREMASAWEDMSDIDQAAALELMGGKRQANVLASILTNFDTVENIIETSMNSAGSAMEENEKWLDSIEGKTYQFTNALQTMWSHMIDSEVIKTFIDFGTGAIKLLDTSAGKVIALVAALKLMAKFKGFSIKGIAQGLSSTINQITTAQQTLETLSQTTKVGKGYDLTNVNAYAQAVQNLTAKQQANLLASAGLNQEQIKYALTLNQVDDAAMREAMAHVHATTAKQQENAVTAQSIQQKAQELAMSLRTQAATADETRAKELNIVADILENATSEEAIENNLKEAVTSGSVSAALKAETTNTLGLTTAKTGLAAATKALMAANPVGFWITVGTTILSLIPIIGELTDAFTKSAEEIKQEAEEITQAYEDVVTEVNNNLKTLGATDVNSATALEKEFATLTAGVDKYGNNLSLTSDEYERYKDICEQIVGINPRIASGYDSATEAIGNNAGVLSELIELQKEQARLAAEEYVNDESLEVLAKDAVNDYKGAKKDKGTGKVESKEDLFGMLVQGTSKETMEYILRTLGYSEADIANKIQEYYLSDVNDYDSFSFISDFIDEIEANTSKFDGYTTELDDFFLEYERTLKSGEEGIKIAQDGLIDTLMIVPKSSANYDKLTREGKSFLTDWIQNSDIFKVDESTTEEDVQDMRDIILKMMSLLVSEAKTVKYNGEVLSAQDILDKIYNFDMSSVPYDKYKNQVNAMLQAFWDSLSDDQKKQYGFTDFESFKISFGFDFETEENQIETAKSQVAGFLDMSVTEIQRKLDGMSAAEVKAFYSIDWNVVGDDGVDTWHDVLEKIHGSIGNNTVTIKTYSVLAESVESYNDILTQTSEIVADNTAVTQEYKDSLIDLGVSEEDLNECFDEANPLIVKNAKALNKLVKETNKNVAANIKLAKSQTRLEYYDLVKQLNSTMNGTKVLDAATRDSVNSTLAQIDAVEKALYQYQLLEDTLLGVNNAFDEFAKAQEIDSMNTYGDSYVEMAQTMYDALYKTGQVGTEAFWSSVEALVPTEVYQHLTDDADRMKAIYDYYNKSILPSLRLDEDELSLDYSAIEEFVKKGLGSGVFAGDVENFDLVEGMNLEKAAELMGMTETQAYALFAELDKYNTAGNEHSFLSQLDDSLEGRITNITNDLEDLNRQKLALLEDGGYAKNKEAIDEINQKISQSETELNKLGQEAYTTWQAYTKNEAALAALDLVADKQRKLTKKEANMLGIEWDKAKEMTVQQAYDTLLGKQLELEEPTILTAQLAIDNIDSQIAELKQKLKDAEKNPAVLGVKADADQVTIDAAKQEIESQIQKLEEDKVVISTTFGIELSEEEKKTLEDELNAIEKFKINDKEFTVVANGTSEVIKLLDAVNDYAKDVTKTVTTEYKTVYTSENKQYSGWTRTPGSGGRYTMADGTAHVDGTAYKEGSWGAPKTETALVGELGPELIVRNGRWTTVGDNGAEFTQVKKGDIIFNHKQTEDLLSKGYVTGRGKLNGGAFASGTAYSGLWNPTSPNTSQSNKPGNDFYKSGQKLYDAADSLSSAAGDIAGSASDASDEFRETFDWIEVRLEEINEKISLKDAKLENAVGYKKQNAIVDDMIELNKNLYDNLIAGANKYYSYASKLLAKVPAEYRKAAQDGSVAIETFVGEVDEKTLEAIQEYRDWVQKGDDLTQQAEETLTEISTLAKQAIDNIAEDYENKTSLHDSKIDQLEAYNSLLETDKGYESESIYEAMIAENKSRIKLLQDQRNKMQETLNEKVKSNEIKVNSPEWYDAVNEISAVDTEIIELKTDTENYQDAINELHWDKFDDLMSRLEAVSSETENLIDILGNKDLVDDSGNWTDEGITTLGLYAQQMENAEMQAKQYQEEIDYLNENWKELGYTEQEYLEKLEELKDGQYDAIDSYNDAKDAIVDLNKERVDAIKNGIEKEIEAYEKLIEKKKEELDAEKDLYDFQKSIMEQEKDVADIKRQLTALSSDNSASARAKRAQLEAELAEAEAKLKDSYYERSVSNQQEALDKELENFQEEKDAEMESWDEYLENTEQVVADSLSTVQANTDAVYQTLQTMGQEYSLSISESITSPWKDGEAAIQSYSEKFGLTISSTVEELKELEKEFDKLNEKIDKTGDKYVNQVNDNADKYTEAEYVEPKKEEPKNDTGKKEETKPSLTKGSYIEVKSGTKWYADSYGGGSAGNAKSGKIKYINNDGTHPYNIDGLGWIKKKDIKGYAKGSNNISKDQLAWLDELGEELQLVPDGNGRLAYIKKGTGIVPADLTERLVDLAMNPQEMLDRNRPEIKLPSEISNTEIHIDNSIGELIHIDNCSTENLPDVKKIVNDALEKHTQKLNNALRKYAR